MDNLEAWRWSIHVSPVDGEITDYHIPQMVEAVDFIDELPDM